MLITKLNYKNIKSSELKVSVIECKNGFKTLALESDGKERLIHSKYDPVKEARRQTHEFISGKSNNITFVVFGLGMGYHLYEILKIVPKNGKLWVFEPCPYICRLFFENSGESLLHDNRISFFAIDGHEETEEILSNIFNVGNCDMFSFFAHPVYTALFSHEHNSLVGRINAVTSRLLTEKSSIEKFGLMWSQNHILNYKYLFESANVLSLFGLFNGKSAIIVSAGPSLLKNVALLKSLDNRAVIICVDTAFKTLCEHEIRPHILVSVSGNRSSFNKLNGVDYSIPLVYKSQTAWRVVENHNGIKFYAAYLNEFLDKILSNEGIKTGFLDSGGSVACTALDLAVKMGFKSIILIGQDLALTDGKTHTANAAKKLTKFEAENFVIETDDIYGGKINTLKNLNRYRLWFEEHIKKYNQIDFIDATEGGALIEGTKIEKLSNVLENLPKEPINAAEMIANAFTKNPLLTDTAADAVKAGYHKLYNELSELKIFMEKIIDRYEAGDSFTWEQMQLCISSIYEYTSAIKYSVLYDLYILENLIIGREPERELQILKSINASIRSCCEISITRF